MRPDEGEGGTGSGGTGGNAPAPNPAPTPAPAPAPTPTPAPAPTADDSAKALSNANESLTATRRENVALRQMLAAHNVPVALDAGRLATLTVAADGSVSGDYGYKRPVPQAPAAPAPTPAASPP